MSNPQKLHIISYINCIYNAIKQNIILFAIVVGVNIWQFDFSEIRDYIGLGIVLMFFIISLVSQILEVYSTRYWLEDDHFIVTHGVFNKNRKELNVRKIQSFETTQGVIDQLVNGVKLQIKTPSDGVELETITKSQSQMIEQSIRNKQLELLQKGDLQLENKKHDLQDTQSLDNEQTDNQNIIFKMSFKTLLLMALTSGAVGVTFAALSPIFNSVEDFIPWDSLTHGILSWVNSAFKIVFVITVALIIVSYIVGTAIMMIRYYHYTVTQSHSQLKVSYGLLNVKNITVPTDRLQAVVEKQSLLRKLFGYTSIHFIITSDSDVTSEVDVSTKGRVMILPFIKQHEAYRILADLVPEMDFIKIDKGMPLRSFHRHFFIFSVIILILASIGTYFWSVWSFGIAAVLILIRILHAWVYFKCSGMAQNDSEIAVSELTFLTLNSYYFKKDKILEIETEQHPFLQRARLATINFILAKGAIFQGVTLKFEDEHKVENVTSTFLRGESNDNL
ncbi:PH domain-containing protein [Staphylococcus lugdunensis]|uniref:YdbS-like PH domain-containing protein n=2 Tax=Staphylococcus lugdunensis TaxID=28035 RepID=A0A4Q9W6V0_STALU|nr:MULTISPECIES: PH domain-containing protein [Staphylococcus]AMG62497.1 hypothetical protein AL499_11215 [Staphylococcus lugdunensis]ARJ11030.1 hypothetical protein B7466_04305 [Staphylococcus lugdunensis]AST60519.1 hypothetical protein BFP67_06930 [Staphylococcus lugdunensis]ATG68447.1 hypothetical protein CPG32_01985 [Staphylococcus lugdunensis]ATN15994.1 hypothetical protein CRN64_11375 [Staphylococcus lugdunensis]